MPEIRREQEGGADPVALWNGSCSWILIRGRGPFVYSAPQQDFNFEHQYQKHHDQRWDGRHRLDRVGRGHPPADLARLRYTRHVISCRVIFKIPTAVQGTRSP